MNFKYKKTSKEVKLKIKKKHNKIYKIINN